MMAASEMSHDLKIRRVTERDRAEWLRMRRALWPEEHPVERLEADIADFLTKHRIWSLPCEVFVLDRDESSGRLGGFVEVSKRPVADGCVTSPVGYLEAWYVDPDLRRRGFGKELVEAAEQWAREQGCREMASDCRTDNHVSHQSHLALGYASTLGCILFRKPLVDLPGAGERDFIGLLPSGLSASTAVKLVTDPAAGGIDLFLGTTRSETHADGRQLIALDYEAYEEMVLTQLHDLARRAREKWPICRQAILHRTGRVELGEASVLIAVSTPHRAEAFAACRWLIDTLKAEVAIWKKEVWSDGTGTWVHPGSSS